MSQKVRWGILSTANIGRKLVIPAIQRANNTEVVAMASRGEQVYEAAKELQIPKTYTSYEELLLDPEIDAVYIPLPNHLHKEWVLKAAASKKHILVEKPAGLTAAEVKEMQKACADNGVIIMEAFMYRFHQQHEAVQKWIDEGKIGDVQMMRASFSFQMRDPENNIRMKPEFGGGAMYDVGCYTINSFRYFLGEPTSVVAEAVFNENGVDLTAHGILQFSSNVKGVFDTSFTMSGRNEYEIIGTEGRIHVPYAYRPDAYPEGGSIHLYTDEGQETQQIDHDQYRAQAEHISKCILDGTTPIYSLENTYLNMKVIDAVYESMRKGVRVTI
ncbi:Gfo/Idh/MocA family protein [Bacillus horti]|uniref:Dehydrogenase n=1 Tax=Caldalkalibacillus horti TaxID=77523 RepID=A0ABT9W336_9BACI|nr:Gfo/Idh/MocA family oxidoreductase [Bacillus horti]MDQ0167651.1 putative dehydrogenase [Bacillus horti]